MRIESCTEVDPALFPPGALECRHLIHPAVREFPEGFRTQRTLDRMRSTLSEGGELWLCREARACAGALLLAPLPHESRHFGMGCARLALLECWSAARGEVLGALLDVIHTGPVARDSQMLWIQTPAWDYELQHVLEERGFRFADTVIDWRGLVADLEIPAGDESRIEAGVSAADAERLGAIAAGAMRFNRFESNPRFPSEGIGSLYREIGARCARGEIGDALLIAREPGGRAAGFASLEWAEQRSLGAPLSLGYFRFLVRAEDAPTGTGQALLDAGCRWLRERGADHILAQTVIQNCGMIRSAFSRGFRVEASFYDWFWWRR